MLTIEDDGFERFAEGLMIQIDEENKRHSLFNANRQDMCMKDMVEYLKKHECINAVEFYDESELSISDEEFCFLMDNLLDYASVAGKEYRDEKCTDMNKLCYVSFEDVTVRIFMVWGEGLLSSISLLKEESADAFFHYNELKEFQKINTM
jgi:hypothetical protein